MQSIGIIMNGVTGRMGTNQHLVRSILAIREQGGVTLADGSRLMPDPVLLGRNQDKVRGLAERYGLDRWSTSLEDCLADSSLAIYFDALSTNLRTQAVKQAIAAGKHVYCEKPLATDMAGAMELARLAREAGIINGVVQDKLFLPGMLKLRRLVESGFFGRILSVRGEFGYWVFEGDWQPAQRPSWNYRKEDGGGIILDMMPHWRYVLDNVISPVQSVLCHGTTHIPERVDESGNSYAATADDAAYAMFELEGGIVAQINSLWSCRVYRDELFVIQVDGTEGSAIAGLRECRSQHRVNTPKPVWNPDIENPFRFREQWEEVPANAEFGNGFKAQWEQFLRAVAENKPFKWDFVEGAKGVQLADLAMKSWHDRCWKSVPEISL